MAVAGCEVDPFRLPSHSNLRFQRDPALATAAINAVAPRMRMEFFIIFVV